MKKYANKERGLRNYSEGKDLYGQKFHVQDGSWACFPGVRIYAFDSANEPKEICLSLKISGAKKLIHGLQKFIENNQTPQPRRRR